MIDEQSTLKLLKKAINFVTSWKLARQQDKDSGIEGYDSEAYKVWNLWQNMEAHTKLMEEQVEKTIHFQEGLLAKQLGKQPRDCPYDRRKQTGKDWIIGWLQGEPPEDASYANEKRNAAQLTKRT